MNRYLKLGSCACYMFKTTKKKTKGSSVDVVQRTNKNHKKMKMNNF